MLIPLGMVGQNTLRGTVIDKANNQPVPFANVTVKSTSNGVQTDLDGKFELSGLKAGDVVAVSFLGYKDFTLTYSNQSTVNVALETDASALQEVVVQIGYGSVRKKDATGAVELITSDEFNKGAIVSVDQLLVGRAAGVRITTSGGQPDSDPNIRIRGGSSLNGSNKPLIVIDGVPISSDNPAGVNNPFGLINPNDVESFSILKDASATAIYGVRASNGVIIITTKSGTKSATPKYNYSSYVAVGEVSKKIDVMDGNQYAAFIQQYFPDRVKDLGISNGVTYADDDPTPAINRRVLYNTDWQDQIYQTSISQDHNLSVRSNLYGKIPFRASIGYNNSQGVVKTSDYERYSYSLKMTPTLWDDHLKIDVNAKGAYSIKNAIDEGGAIGGAISMDPTKPVYSSDPFFGGYYQNTDGNTITGASNPLAVLMQRTRPERALRFIGNTLIDYKMHFLPELHAVVNLGLDASESRIREVYGDNAIATYRKVTPANAGDPNFVFNPGVNYVENQTTTNRTMDAYLRYEKNFSGFITRIDAQAGYNYQNFVIDGNKEIYRYNVTDGTRELQPDKNANQRYYSPLNLQGYFARANVDILGRYLLTGTFRADASSLFSGSENQYGYFPAAAAAWQIKEESFLKDVSFVDDLKLRIGYGKTGNQDITGARGYFPSRPLFTIASSTTQYLPGANLYSANPFDPNVTWETTETYNAGLDFGFFKEGRVSGSVDFYKRRTNDLLATYNVPPGQGLTNQFTSNVGTIDGEGVELSLNFDIVKNENYSFSLNANGAYNRSEVKDLNGNTNINSPGGTLPSSTGGIQLAYNTVGYQPHVAWVFQQLYDANGQPIIGAFSDLNGDNKITNADRYYKSIRPNWTYGFGLNFTAYNFDFTTNFRGQFGGQVYNSRRLTEGFIDRATQGASNALNNVLDFYANDDVRIVNFNDGNSVFSDNMLEDATFLRCDNATLGYKFKTFLKNTSLRIYGSVNNVFVVTKYSGQDPENFNGIDNNFYPRPRIYTFGLNFDF